MAYNTSNEIRTILGTFDKNSKGEKIMITKIENTKYKSMAIDVRTMYTITKGERAGELGHSPEGLRINSEVAEDVIVSMLMALESDEIKEILAIVQYKKEAEAKGPICTDTETEGIGLKK